MYPQLSEREEWLGKEIVDSTYKVHRELGPGLLEKIYEACLCYELEKEVPLIGGNANYPSFMTVKNLMKASLWMS